MNYLDPACYPQRVDWKRLVTTTVKGTTRTATPDVERADIPCRIGEAPNQVMLAAGTQHIASAARIAFRESIDCQPGDILVGKGMDAGRTWVVRATRYSRGPDVQRWVVDAEERSG